MASITSMIFLMDLARRRSCSSSDMRTIGEIVSTDGKLMVDGWVFKIEVSFLERDMWGIYTWMKDNSCGRVDGRFDWAWAGF